MGFSLPRSGVSRSDMDSPMLRSRALLHAASLRVLGAAVFHAPTLDDGALLLDRAREELEGLERALDTFRELHATDLTEEVHAAASALPLPVSWLEATVAQLVLGIAAQVQARDGVPVRAQKAENVAAARSALRDLWATSPASLAPLSRLLTRWLDVVCSVLPEPEQRSCLASLRREFSPAPAFQPG